MNTSVTTPASIESSPSVVRNYTATESRALELLGQGLSGEVVAAAVGVSASRISQLLSTPEFAAAVAEKRFLNLSRQTNKDSAYDSIEEQLLEKMAQVLPMMYKPMEILKAISVINSAKRRGLSAPETLQTKSETINLIMPTQIFQHFTTNINNQVIKAGQQDLLTVQSGQMDSLLSLAQDKRKEVIENVSSTLKQNDSVSRASS